jgi:hypothetical protein
MTPSDFRAGLLAVRRRVQGSGFRSYFIESNNHTWIHFPDWHTTRVGGVALSAWANAIATGEGEAAELGPGAP